MNPNLVSVVICRLFALTWVISSIPRLISFLTIRNEYYHESILPFTLTLISGIVLWFIAPKFSKLITGGFDEELKLDWIRPQQLYSSILVGLGIYFALSSLGSVFNWIHYFTIRQHLKQLPELLPSEPSFYDFSERALTFLVGILLVCLHRKISRKLAMSTLQS